MKSIVFFVYYNPRNAISGHTKHTLQFLRKSYDEVVIISNGRLSDKERSVLGARCDKLIVRSNKGYDFAAWRDGLRDLGWDKLEKYHTITLINDTCYFPLFPIEELRESFNKKRNIDFWGGSIHRASNRGLPGSDKAVPQHLQSYFMVFKKRVVASKVFQNFWDGVEDLEDVEEVIRRYEVGLTLALTDKGFKYDAIYNPSNYKDRGVINAAYQIPGRLIARKFPFLKVKAVNRVNKETILEQLRKSKSQYPTNLIKIRQGKVKGAIRYFIQNTHWLFLAIAIPASLAFMLITPVGFGGDEESHLYRAYHISTGHPYPENLDNGDDGQIPTSLVNAVKTGYFLASNSPFGTSIIGRVDISKDQAKVLSVLANTPLNRHETTTEEFSNTNGYTPASYIGAAIGFKFSSIMNLSVGWSVFFARLMNAVPFFAISTLALYLLRGVKLRWLIFCTLLLPTVISYVATINGDPFNIACVMLFFALFIKISTSREPRITERSKALLFASTTMLALAKLPSVVMAILLVFIPSSKFGGARKKNLFLLAVFVSILLLSIILTLVVGDNMHGDRMQHQLRWALQNPDDTIVLYARTLYSEIFDYMNRSVGVMGRNGVFVHPALVTLITANLLILSLWLDKSSKKIAALTSLTGISLCFMVLTLLFLVDNKIGTGIIWGVHGKYFTPFLPLILYGFTALPISVVGKGHYMEYSTILISGSVLIAAILTYLLALY